jgi:hypothetical protein
MPVIQVRSEDAPDIIQSKSAISLQDSTYSASDLPMMMESSTASNFQFPQGSNQSFSQPTPSALLPQAGSESSSNNEMTLPAYPGLGTLPGSVQGSGNTDNVDNALNLSSPHILQNGNISVAEQIAEAQATSNPNLGKQQQQQQQNGGSQSTRRQSLSVAVNPNMGHRRESSAASSSTVMRKDVQDRNLDASLFAGGTTPSGGIPGLGTLNATSGGSINGGTYSSRFQPSGHLLPQVPEAATGMSLGSNLHLATTSNRFGSTLSVNSSLHSGGSGASMMSINTIMGAEPKSDAVSEIMKKFGELESLPLLNFLPWANFEETETTKNLPPSVRNSLIKALILRLVDRVTAIQQMKLVLVFDNAQWIDHASMDVLANLFRRRVCVIVLTRPLADNQSMYAMKRLSEDPNTIKITLNGLKESEVEASKYCTKQL